LQPAAEPLAGGLGLGRRVGDGIKQSGRSRSTSARPAARPRRQT
jgi:hypothetical protein